MSKKRTRVRLGDIIEIPLSSGSGYAQYTHRSPKFGDLVRVLPGTYAKKPESFSSLVESDELFWTFVLLAGSVKDELCRIVANLPIPESCQEIPQFRTGFRNPRTGKVAKWQIWTNCNAGELVESLTVEQAELSLLVLMTIPSLGRKIESGWTPRDDV